MIGRRIRNKTDEKTQIQIWLLVDIKLLERKAKTTLLKSETDTDIKAVLAAVRTVYGDSFDQEEVVNLVKQFNSKAKELLQKNWKWVEE